MGREEIASSVAECVRAAQFLEREESLLFIEQVAFVIARCFEGGGKLLVAGNGGSLCDATHFTEELTGVFRKKRKAFPAIALSDPGHLTCVANDLGFDQVFARGVEAYGKPGDVLVLLTTSGKSENLYEAFRVGREKGLSTVAFLGKDGGLLKGKCDHEWIVEGFSYSDRIQEAHMAAIHIVIEQIERELHVS